MPLHALGDLVPKIPAGPHFIAPDARLIGHVIIEEEASVWFGAVLRAEYEPIHIGPRTNVQDGVIAHVDPGFPMRLGRDVSIGHNAIIHGCTVEDGALIGMGATVMNGAVIGAGSLVGANALVTEGKVFPPRSLILGSPAKRVRELTDDEVRGCLETAAGYVKRVAMYTAGFR